MRRTILSKKKVARLAELHRRHHKGVSRAVAWTVPYAVVCEICGNDESTNLSAAEDVARIRLCGDHYKTWLGADFSLDWLNDNVPNRHWELMIRGNCPGCHAWKSIPKDDYLCKACRNGD